MTSIDLQKFCGTDPFRDYLHKPITQDGFTWATDGAVMVRAPADKRYSPCERPINIAKPLSGIEDATFSPPNISLPPAPERTGPCPECDGRGREHDCPDCECICEACHGAGELNAEKRTTTTIRGAIFNLAYVRLIASLPNVEFSQSDGKKPMFFRFDGGVGALMPCRCALDEHIEIEGGAQ